MLPRAATAPPAPCGDARGAGAAVRAAIYLRLEPVVTKALVKGNKALFGNDKDAEEFGLKWKDVKERK